MSDAIARLNAALEGRYVIERELDLLWALSDHDKGAAPLLPFINWGGWGRTTNLLGNKNVGKYPIPVIFAQNMASCPFLTGQWASDNRS